MKAIFWWATIFFVIPTLAPRVLFRPTLLGPLGSDYGPKELGTSGQKVSPSLGLPCPAISLSPISPDPAPPPLLLFSPSVTNQAPPVVIPLHANLFLSEGRRPSSLPLPRAPTDIGTGTP